MNRNMNRKLISSAATTLLVLTALPVVAQDFDAPGSHTWVLDKNSNTAVNPNNTRQIKGITSLTYGEDFLIGGKGTINSGSSYAKQGFVPIAVGSAIYGCSTSRCTVSVTYTKSSCTTDETTYAITSSSDIYAINSLNISVTSVYEQKLCSASENTAAQIVQNGDIASGYKVVPLLAVGYKNLIINYNGNKIYWSPGKPARVQPCGQTSITHARRSAGAPPLLVGHRPVMW
jgi:hypothetical protein